MTMVLLVEGGGLASAGVVDLALGLLEAARSVTSYTRSHASQSTVQHHTKKKWKNLPDVGAAEEARVVLEDEGGGGTDELEGGGTEEVG